MMSVYALEKIANALSGRIVAAGLDRVVLTRQTQYSLSAMRRSQGEGPWCRGKASLKHDKSY